MQENLLFPLTRGGAKTAGVCIMIGSEHLVRCKRGPEHAPSRRRGWATSMRRQTKIDEKNMLNQNRGIETQKNTPQKDAQS
jgi:hypothetical protein